MIKIGLFSLGLCLVNLASAYDLFELKMKLVADGGVSGEAIQHPQAVQSNVFPSDIAVGFDDQLNSRQVATWTVTNNSASDLHNVKILSYADIEIQQSSNTFSMRQG